MLPLYSLFIILLDKTANFRSCHAKYQQADVAHGDSINLIASVKLLNFDNTKWGLSQLKLWPVITKLYINKNGGQGLAFNYLEV